MTKTQGTMRGLLSRIGVGQFQATSIIQFMFMAPATTDPKSPSIILLVTQLQRALQKLGYPIRVTGYLERETAACMAEVVGPGWESRSWGDNVSAVVNGLATDRMYTGELAKEKAALPPVPAPKAVGFWDPPFLPSIPGGIVTYGVLGAVAYHLLSKRKR